MLIDMSIGYCHIYILQHVQRLQFVSLLIERGADINNHDVFGNVPLFQLIVLM